jgi:hypothetical protein
MLLFEFQGALFQFEQREPALLPLFQLPLSRSSFCSLRSPDPCPEHPAGFREVNRGGLMLV